MYNSALIFRMSIGTMATITQNKIFRVLRKTMACTWGKMNYHCTVKTKIIILHAMSNLCDIAKSSNKIDSTSYIRTNFYYGITFLKTARESITLSNILRKQFIKLLKS